MKQLYSLIAIILTFSLSLSAQNPIPNASFENWAGGNPVDWATSNVPGVVTNITQSSDARTGSSAARGEVASFSGVPLPPSLIAQPLSTGGLIPISQKYETLTGYYKMETQGDDAVFVSVEVYAAGGGLIGAKNDLLPAVGSYTQFSLPIDYFQSGDAANARISFTVLAQSGGASTVGSAFHVDDLEFMGLVAIEPVDAGYVPQSNELRQNYPNPFNPNTTIEFSLHQSEHVVLTVFNALGQEVSRLIDEPLATGVYRSSWESGNLPGGTYFYRLQAGSFTETKKMVLSK